jgi:radical SAM protein with 4Fe4S-binding SPASM domain
MLDYFKKIGVRYVCAAPTYYSTVSPETRTPSLMKFCTHFVDAFYHALKNDMFYMTHLMVNFDEIVDNYCRACTPCPHLTTDGYVSCCDWASFGPKYLPGPLQDLIYGYFDKEAGEIVIDKEKVERIKRRNIYQELNKCKNCIARHHCAGGCLGKMVAATGNIYDITDEWCEAVKYLFQKLPVNKGMFPIHHS